MKFFRPKISLLLLFLLALVSQVCLAVAGEIPGYIGQQSFHLMDDPELREMSRRTDDLKMELARIDQSRVQFEDQVRIIERQRNEHLEKMNSVIKEIETSKASKSSLETKLAELNKTPEVNAEQITAVKTQIQQLEHSIAENSRLAGALKIELGPINVRLEQIRADHAVIVKRVQDAQYRLQHAVRERESYRQDLIASIQHINKEGANRGQVDGSNDGFGLSRRLGQERGSKDGDGDGFTQGTIDGQDRFYRKGAEQGERDGSARARLNGERDGTIEGTKSGNTNAGNREGRIAGLKRGDESNAAAVGAEQGKKAGMERAASTGAAKGAEIGENETVLKFENDQLNSVQLSGPFAGSFQRRVPGYPGDFNGPSFNPSIYNSRDVLRKAFADGYVQTYRDFTRYEFLKRIDGEYNSAYDHRYAVAYDNAVNRDYPEHFEKGRKEADARAYNRDYPIVKAEAFRIAFNKADSYPSRSSAEFSVAYKNSELQAYNERYEQIRRTAFDKLELEVFNANIASQTEVFRQKRIKEVSTVYSNNAVLKFISSEMFDGGINGIAAFDGVFQPSETTLHSVTLKNFGLKAAQNVSVQLDNGDVVKLPEIPAKSEVTVKGAGIAKILNNDIGSTAKLALRVVSGLNTTDAVEGRHFDQLSGGILKIADRKQVKVAYPLSLNNLSLSSQLLKGVPNKLSIVVNNESKRVHKGDLRIQLLVNSQSNVITKEFSDLSEIATSTQLTDAEVLVTSESDIYRDLSFSATISQRGVTLGVLKLELIAMAKAQYAEVAGRPVIVAHSDKNLSSLLDALATLGGSEKVSILDLSLASLNAAVLNAGLNQKVLVILDDANASNVKSLNAFIAKSKTSSFVFADAAGAGLKVATTLEASKDAQKLLWDNKTVMFTNPHRAPGVLKSSAMIQSSLRNLESDLPLARNLALSATELVERFKAEVNRHTFFTPNNLIKVFSLKALAEILTINKAYDESGGIFSRDKKWAEMISKDKGLLINVLKDASNGDVDEAKLATVLPAIALKDTLSNAMSNSDAIFKIMMPKITNATNKVLDDMEDSFKKSLKKFNKDLYNNAYEKASIHRPFFIEPAANPNI